jgi:hypothetical protein
MAGSSERLPTFARRCRREWRKKKDEPRSRGINRGPAAFSHTWQRRIPRAADRGPANLQRRMLIRRLTMNASRILSAVFVLLALAFGSLATSACTSATDSSASGSSGNSSGGGY